MDSNVLSSSIEPTLPAGCSVTWRVGEVPPQWRFWAIPGNEGPRWVVPQEPALGLPVLDQWRPYGRWSPHVWTLIKTAYRAGQLGHLPRVAAVGITGADAADWRPLGWHDETPPAPVIYVGTPAPTQKAVATLVRRPDRTPAAVLKAPIGPAAGKRIRAESAVLARLAGEKPGIAPRLLHADPDRSVSLQEMVRGRPAPRDLSAAHIEWLNGMRIPGREVSLRSQVDRLRGRLAAVDGLDQGLRATLEAALDTIDLPLHLPATWAHGDFTPWNLKLRGSGSLGAVDWEFAEPDQLPGVDIAHYLSRVIGAGTTDAATRRVEDRVLSGLASPSLTGILGGATGRAHRVALWRHYVICYLVVLLETESDNPFGAMFRMLCARWSEERNR